VTATAGDLQSTIAAYMSKFPNLPLPLADIAAGTGLTQTQAQLILDRIVKGEARPYPITKTSRGYRWITTAGDRPASVAVLAEMIGYVTGADHDQAKAMALGVLQSWARHNRS
jgi:hypothetical protein